VSPPSPPNNPPFSPCCPVALTPAYKPADSHLSRSVLRKGSPVASKYEFIETMRLDTEEYAYPVEFMCERLGVSKSGYYDWRARPDSATAQRREELKLLTTRYTVLVHLPRQRGYGALPRSKNGPPLAGYGAVTMKDALAVTIGTLPEQLWRSLTWDRGKELSAHAQFTVETGVPVYFADPHSPWQRGTNENTNGLLRQYFPKGTDLSRWAAEDIEAVAATLNSRPRKSLGWKTPAEALNDHLLSIT
ncbi:IS30 family transposase, partial [Streptomyces sp. NPDC004393]